MGYGGYAPGANSRMADQLSDLEVALRQLPLEDAVETLDVIRKMVQNVIRNPSEDRFRRIRFTNAKIKAVIVDVPGAVELLKAMGWVEEEGFGGAMVLPASVRPAHEVEIVGIIEAKDYYKKEQEKQHRREVAARKEADPEREALLAQAAADRAEKAAEGPVTQASRAQELGQGHTVTAADLGIGKSAGG